MFNAGHYLLLFSGGQQVPVDLVEAVIAWLHADAVVNPQLAEIVGDEAATGSTYPYVVIEEIEQPTTFQSATGDGTIPYDDTLQLRVTLVHTDKQLGRALGRQVDKSIDDAPLVISTGIVQFFRRESAPHDVIDPDRTVGGADVWRRIYVYDAVISRTL